MPVAVFSFPTAIALGEKKDDSPPDAVLFRPTAVELLPEPASFVYPTAVQTAPLAALPRRNAVELMPDAALPRPTAVELVLDAVFSYPNALE